MSLAVEVLVLGLVPEGGMARMASGILDVECLPLRPDDLLETLFLLSMSLKRKGGAALWLVEGMLLVVEF